MTESSGPFGGSVLKCLDGKHVFITGATGFVGKVLVEKILRSVPNVGKIYLLVRAQKGSTAAQRMHKEIVSSPIFDRLRKDLPNFDQFIASKLQAISGELTQNNVGISREDMQVLCENSHMIFHSAAVVDFNERIDRAVELNVMGSLRMLEIAKNCKRLGAFVHVSTCYTNSNRQGWIDEKLYPLGFDPEAMIEKIQKLSLTEIEKVVSSGILGDWPNTYTFTKAITEHLLVKNRAHVPLVILRPSIIGCSHKEPQPGWVDVISAAGAVYAAVGLGVVKMLPGRLERVADLIPVDFVVNAILVVVPAIYGKDHWFVCHSASSAENPLRWGVAADAMIKWFRQTKLPGQVSTPDFLMVTTPQAYQVQFFLRYSVPSAIINSVAKFGSSAQRQKAALFEKMVFRVRVLVNAFSHFLENEWVFDNRTLRALYRQLNSHERKLFNLDLGTVDWYTYHIAFAWGLSKFVLKADLFDLDSSDREDFNNERWRPQQSWVSEKFAPDLSWAVKHANSMTKPQRSLADMRSTVLSSPRVQAEIKYEIESKKWSSAQVEARAKHIIDKMFGDQHPSVVAGMGWFFKKVWKRLYTTIEVEMDGLKAVREAAKRGPIAYLPSHRSYLDFLVVSYVCFTAELPMPHIAAGEDFLGILFVRWLFRNAGAFFMRRQFGGDRLYTAIIQEYVERLLHDGQALELFIEGTRSRSGKYLHPKQGLLSIITGAYLDKKVPDLTLLPMTINYEKTMEQNLFSSELVGNPKFRESLKGLLKSRDVLNVKYGAISVCFGEPILMSTYTEAMKSRVKGSVLTDRYVPKPAEIMAIEKAPAAPVAEPAVAAFDPFGNQSHRRYLNRQLAYEVVGEMTRVTECMPTHLVATIMLQYRQGITRDQLLNKVDWVRREVELRGGRLAGFSARKRPDTLDEAIKLLHPLVAETRHNVLEPAISARHEYNNMLALDHYRNKLVHLFFYEGLIACALYALVERSDSVPRADLMKEVAFLHALLHREVIVQADPDHKPDLDAVVETMIARGILHLTDNGRLEVGINGHAHFSFLCSLVWPFIDSYFAASLMLVSIPADSVIEQQTMVTRTQTLAVSLYHESMLCYYESCSMETLLNAQIVLESWGILTVSSKIINPGKKNSLDPPVTKRYVQLNAKLAGGDTLRTIVDHISRLRKPPAVRKSPFGRNLIADIPMLARL